MYQWLSAFFYAYIYIIMNLEEGTHIARTDGGRRGILYTIYIWRNGPVLHGQMGKDGAFWLLYIIYYWRKGLVLHGQNMKTVLWHIYDEIILYVCVDCLILDSHSMITLWHGNNIWTDLIIFTMYFTFTLEFHITCIFICSFFQFKA